MELPILIEEDPSSSLFLTEAAVSPVALSPPLPTISLPKYYWNSHPIITSSLLMILSSWNVCRDTHTSLQFTSATATFLHHQVP